MLENNSRYFPYIAQVRIRNYEHYIVVYEFSKNKVILMDPAFGKKIISKEDFFNISTGIIIEFYPRREILIMKKDNTLLDIFLKIFTLEKKYLLSIIFASILFTIANIANSFYFKVGIENIGNDIKTFKVMTILFLIIVVFKIILIKLRISYQVHLNKNLQIRLYKEFFEHLFALPSKSVENKSLGEIVTRISDLGNIKKLFSEIVVSVFLDFVLTLIAIPILIYIDVKLFIIFITMLIVYLMIGIIFSKVIYRKIIYNKEKEVIFNTKIIESINMFKNIRNLNKIKNTLKQIENTVSEYIYSSFDLELLYSYENNIKNSINELGCFMINAIGLFLIYEHKLEIIDLITFNTLISFFLSPIQNLIDNIPRYHFIRASIYKLNEFMSLEVEETSGITTLKKYDIEFKGVSYSYSEFSELINNLSFKIKENDHIFLKAKSGGGKSTICKLMLKNAEYYSGEILFGGVNIKDISTLAIREKILYISQNEYIITNTLKENILFYNDYETEKFNEICKICKIEEILKNKKVRYETLIETDANNFSGGEKQRIILARACLNVFSVLIIDEALSEVDYRTEKEIIRKLRNYFKNKTIIYISHKNVEKMFQKVILLNAN